MGVDKYGNKYYQYYAFHGLPTNRVVLYKFFDTNKFHIDPHFVSWLHKQDLLPPTPEELELKYIEHEQFIQRCIAYDKEQKLIMDEWRKKKEELDKEYERGQLDAGTSSWDPNA